MTNNNFLFKIITITIAAFILMMTAFDLSKADAAELTGQFSQYELENASLCNRYFAIYEKKYHMPTNMLRAISVTESGKYSKQFKKGIAWPWTINVGGRGYHFKSREEAKKVVKQALASGKESIDIGCMQVNLKYHPQAFKSLNQAFEPRYNIAYAAKMLSDTYERYGSWETAIRYYHNVNKTYSDKYLSRVYDSWHKEDKAVDLALLESPVMYMKVKPRPRSQEPEADFSDITKSVLETFIQ